MLGATDFRYSPGRATVTVRVIAPTATLGSKE